MKSVGAQASLDPKWYTVAQAAQHLGYGETKGRMLIISGDRRSLKDERARRVLPEWVEDYVRLRASELRIGGVTATRRQSGEGSISLYPDGLTTLCVGFHEQRLSAAQIRHRLPPSGKANTAHPIGRTTGAESMNQTQSEPSEPPRVRDGDTARNLRFWTRPPPQSWGRPPSSAASQPTPRPQDMRLPPRAVGSGWKRRRQPVPSCGIEPPLPRRPDLHPRPDLHIYGSGHVMDRLLTVDQARELLNTGPRFVRRLVAEHRIELVQVGRHIRIAESALARFVEAGSVPVMTVPGGHRA
jgi:excisionase family DNA binding protein